MHRYLYEHNLNNMFRKAEKNHKCYVNYLQNMQSIDAFHTGMTALCKFKQISSYWHGQLDSVIITLCWYQQ